MHNHFDKNLNLREIILTRKPKVVVECGAGNGELTRQLASLLDVYAFRLCIISDYAIEGLDPRIEWMSGISYNALQSFGKGSIDLCILDTDHNYWTLMQELSVLFNRMAEKGLIAMHDVESFYHDTGMALKYSTGDPYPLEEIEKCSPYGSLGDALLEFLHTQKIYFRMYAWNHESNGAAVIEKKFEPMFAIKTPGPGAIYTKSKETSHAMLQAS